MSFASDKAYGRQGGRFVDGPSARETLDVLHRIRLQEIRKPTQPGKPPAWPDASIDAWRRLADQARTLRAAGAPLDDTLERALEVDDTARAVGR